jgi:hypothetical protein
VAGGVGSGVAGVAEAVVTDVAIGAVASLALSVPATDATAAGLGGAPATVTARGTRAIAAVGVGVVTVDEVVVVSGCAWSSGPAAFFLADVGTVGSDGSLAPVTLVAGFGAGFGAGVVAAGGLADAELCNAGRKSSAGLVGCSEAATSL